MCVCVCVQWPHAHHRAITNTQFRIDLSQTDLTDCSSVATILFDAGLSRWHYRAASAAFCRQLIKVLSLPNQVSVLPYRPEKFPMKSKQNFVGTNSAVNIAAIAVSVLAATIAEDYSVWGRSGSYGTISPLAFARLDDPIPAAPCFDHIKTGKCYGTLACEGISIQYADTTDCEFLDARPSSLGVDQCNDFTVDGEPATGHEGERCTGAPNVENTDSNCQHQPCLMF